MMYFAIVERRNLAAAAIDQASWLQGQGHIQSLMGDNIGAGIRRQQAEEWLRRAEYLLNGETPDEL